MSLIDYIFLSEFDIDKGSLLKLAYPNQVPYYSHEYLADLMLPEGIHHLTEDITYFFLNHHTSTSCSLPFLYGMNIVNTRYGTIIRRGAYVKAIAICSKYPIVEKFKGILQEILKDMMDIVLSGKEEEEEDTKRMIEEFYKACNSMTTKPMIEPFLSQLSVIYEERKRDIAYGIQYSGKIPLEQRMEEKINVSIEWKSMTYNLEITARECLYPFSTETITMLLQTFKHKTMDIYNSIVAGDRVLFVGSPTESTGKLCHYVLAAVSIVSPPLVGMLHHCYPYANLTDMNFLKTPGGYVAGVNNPIFRTQKDSWDLLCDITNGSVLFSNHKNNKEVEEYEDFDKKHIARIMEGIKAKFPDEWIQLQFELYTRKHIIDIVLGEDYDVNMEKMAERNAKNTKRLTKWSTSTSCVKTKSCYHANDIFPSETIKDLKCFQLGIYQLSTKQNEAVIENLFNNFLSMLRTEKQLHQFLLCIPIWRSDGLHSIAQGLFHVSSGIRSNTALVLYRIQDFEALKHEVQQLNIFILLALATISKTLDPRLLHSDS